MIGNSLRVGLFLAVRYVLRNSIWSTLLIVFIMLLTFLNVIFVRGILVGLPEGVQMEYQKSYSGDIFITTLPDESYIQKSRMIENIVKGISGYENHTSRYIEPGIIEVDFKVSRKDFEIADTASVLIVGIDPIMEDQTTQISSRIIEGEYLNRRDRQNILIADDLLERLTVGAPFQQTVSDAQIGDKVLISVSGQIREYTVGGILSGKVFENDQRVFMVDAELRNLIGRFDQNVDEIAITLIEGTDPENFRDQLLASKLGDFATIETSRESQGKFLGDVVGTFEILSSIIGLVGIIVASLTVFVVIFVFAITRQKQIGILKGIGISSMSIELSYVILAVFYAAIGITLGLLIVFLFLKPFILEHPIDFPFADGILVASPVDTAVRVGVLMIATIFAGFIPARIVVKKNTINAILGR